MYISTLNYWCLPEFYCSYSVLRGNLASVIDWRHRSRILNRFLIAAPFSTITIIPFIINRNIILALNVNHTRHSSHVRAAIYSNKNVLSCSYASVAQPLAISRREGFTGTYEFHNDKDYSIKIYSKVIL